MTNAAVIEAASGLGWVPVCRRQALTPDRGVAALVGGEAVAVFCLSSGELYALGNVDPFSGAGVLSRGIIGDASGVPTVASPMYKQRFDLRTGACLEDPSRTVPVYPVREEAGVVSVHPARR